MLVGKALCVSIWLTLAGMTSQQYPPLASSVLKLLGEGIAHMNNEPIDQPNMLKEYDFVVVGAGSAGAVVANRLSEVPEWKVLLIEAGQDENYLMDIPILANLLQFSDANWNYRTQPSDDYCLGMENHQCRFPRGKVMGGSSVLNYMIFTRGNKRDYDNWANLGNTGWDWNNVLKYYKKMEDMQIPKYAKDKEYHSTGGYQTISEVPFHSRAAMAFVKGGQELGYPNDDLNGRNQVGFDYHQVTMRNGTRCSTSRAYLHPIRKRRNIHVKKHSMVTKILIDPETKRAYGVEFMRYGRKQRILAKKEIVVSAGSINSPQLLMLSGIGPRKHLEEKNIPVIQDLPVGENLMDHVALGGMTFMLNDTVSIMTQRIIDNPNVLHNFFSNHKGPMTIPGGTEALAFIDLKHPRDPNGWPDLELLFVGGSLGSEATLRRSFGISEYVYNSVYKPVEGQDGIMIFPMIMRPKSKGKIILKDNNPFHHPIIIPNYHSQPEDLDILVQGVRISQKLMKTKAFRRLNGKLLASPLPGCKHVKFDTDEYWRCHARNLPFTIYHLSGTCKMAPAGDPTAVVDPRLRVVGIKGLRVADASIMPEVPAAHTNAPAIMIGEKAGDLIKEDWNRLRKK